MIVMQVLAGLRQVGELLGEELVPLLERGELLERERIDPSELRELALGILQSAPLLRAIERTKPESSLSASTASPGTA